MKIYCQICGRQIVSYKCSDERTVGGGPVKKLFGNQCACCECSVDLDENGLFPEERSLVGNGAI